MIDSKNITRTDLQDIYNQLKDVTHQALKGTGSSIEDFAISDNEAQTVHRIMMAGCALIADKTRRVKYHTQTGIDALTFFDVYENPLDNDDAAGNITNPDSVSVAATAVYNQKQVHETGEKLDVGTGDTLIMEIDGLEDEQQRYTIVQQFVKEAIVQYVLMEWWKLKGQNDRWPVNERDFKKALRNARFNSVSNSKGNAHRVTPRPLG